MNFDVVVLGLGGMGSAALYQLAKRGIRVLGIEQYARGANLGSSASPSRGFRKAYPLSMSAYVALARRAEALWHALEAECSTTLLWSTPALTVGDERHPLVQAMRHSMVEHHLPHEILEGGDITRRYPALRTLPGQIAILEHQAGVLVADRANAELLGLARALGAEVRYEEPVLEVTPMSAGVNVRTSLGSYAAAIVVVTSGAWLAPASSTRPSGLPEMILPLEVERQVELWFEPLRSDELDFGELPLFQVLLNDPQRAYYGIPRFGADGVQGVSPVRRRDHIGRGAQSPGFTSRRRRRQELHSGASAQRERPASPLQSVHEHEHAGQTLRDRVSSSFGAHHPRRRVLRSRVQVRSGYR